MSLDKKVFDGRKIGEIEVVSVDDVVLCNKRWEEHTVPRGQYRAYLICYKCDGFNEGCKHYNPLNLDDNPTK